MAGVNICLKPGGIRVAWMGVHAIGKSSYQCSWRMLDGM